MTRKLLFAVFALLIFLPKSSEAKFFKLDETVFPNGLTVVTVEDNSAPVVTFQMFADVSVRHEKKGITGISHYAEHYFTMGSKKVPPREFSNIISSWGGMWNAYTGLDLTTYYATVPKERLDNVVEMFSDMLVNKTFPEDYFKSEMKVVQEERRLTDNNPARSAFFDFQELLFKGTNYRFPIIGYWDDLKSITLDDLKKFYRDYYSVRNLVFVVAGDVTHSDVVASFMKWFGDVKGVKPIKPRKTRLLPQKRERRLVKIKDGIELPFMIIGYPTFKFDDPDFFALNVFSDVLSDGEGSRFQRSIVREKKLASNIYSYILHTKETGAFVIYAEPVKGVSLSVLERAIYSEMDSLINNGPREEDINKVIARTEKSFITDLQTTGAKANLIGNAYILSKNKAGFYGNFLKNLRKVKGKDVVRIAKKYLKPKNRNVLINIPKGVSYWQADIKKLSSKKFKNCERVKLENGVELYYQESDEIPAVSLQALLKVGSSNDPKGKEGLAVLLGSLLKKGTSNRSEEELARLLDENAIDFSVSVMEEETLLSLSFLKEKTDLAVEIFSDVLKNLSIPDEVLERERKRILSRLEKGKADPHAVGERALSKVLFKGTGLAHSGGGFAKTLKRISSKDLRKFYDKYFAANNMILAVVGDVNEQYIVDVLTGKLEGLRTDGEVPRILTRDFATDKNIFYVVDLPWMSQSYIYAGGKGFSRSDPFFNKARVANYVLGASGLSSRLMSNLRTEMGLAYSVKSYLNYYMGTGTFNFVIQTKTESTKKAIDAFLKEVKDFSKGISKKEFLDAKSYYQGVLPLRMETIGQRSWGIIAGVHYKLGPDILAEDARSIQSFILSDINEEAKKIASDHFVFVVVGQGAEIKKQLKGFGKIREIALSDLF